jgi:hypothetical protein
MALLIHEYGSAVRDEGGRAYRVVAVGEERADGTWIGWLEFREDGSTVMEHRTGRETTQPSFDALRYWSRGIEPIYLEGALSRAISRSPVAASVRGR